MIEKVWGGCLLRYKPQERKRSILCEHTILLLFFRFFPGNEQKKIYFMAQSPTPPPSRY